MKKNLSRRSFIKNSSLFAAAFATAGKLTSCASGNGLFFDISLAQWSLHRALRNDKTMDNLDFAATAANDFGIYAIEYVNQFFKDKAEDNAYLNEMKKRADGNGVKSLLIMCDGEGQLGNTNEAERTKAVENHYKWVDAARFLGCHSIRVNAAGEGTREEVSRTATDGLARLSDYAAQAGLNVLVENHGGYSSDGAWLTNVIANTGKANCGTLPDFGNFCIERDRSMPRPNCVVEYDRYKGVTEMMPFAKAVSAKSHDFNEEGDEIHTDYKKMLTIVKDAGYRGYIGIEYEGRQISEAEGIKATKLLMERVGQALV